MKTMRQSGAAVFTRQNPFPPDPPLPRSHYSPSRSRKISKQQKTLALGPVQLPESSIHPHPPREQIPEPPVSRDLPHTSSLRLKDQVYHERSHVGHLCPPLSSERQLSFSESWPSTDLSWTSDTSASPFPDAQEKDFRAMVAPIKLEPKEPSVLARYIERFRFGKPQSREERQRQTEEGDDPPFWWMSPPSSSTPTQTSEKLVSEGFALLSGGHDSIQNVMSKPYHDESSLSPTRRMLNLSLLSLSASSHCDQEEPDIAGLQERAGRLLQRSEHSLGSGSVPISSEGLGCSEFSSPLSSEEPLRRPGLSTLIPSTIVYEPSLNELEREVFPPAVASNWSSVRREDDILFQWRLRRKMEQARQLFQEGPSHISTLLKPVRQNQTQSPLNSSSHHRANLSFTPVASTSLDPPVLQPSDPKSSPTISRLHSDIPQEELEPDFQPKPLHPLTNYFHSKTPETSSIQTHRDKPIRAQSSIPETPAIPLRAPKSSSPSPQTSESPEEQLEAPQKKRDSAARRKPENNRRERMNAPLNTRKRSERHVDKRGISSLSVKHSRVHERPCHKPQESTGESRWQDEGQKSETGGCSGSQAPPPSPIHNALGQVVSEVLFAGTDSPTPCKSPSSSESQTFTPTPPPQSPVASCSGQQASEVIDQLMRDAEDSDGLEFEDDPLLQLLRQQRKHVKEHLRKVDQMIQDF